MSRYYYIKFQDNINYSIFNQKKIKKKKLFNSWIKTIIILFLFFFIIYIFLYQKIQNNSSNIVHILNIFKNIYEIDDKKIVLLSDNLYTNDIISEKDIFNCFITENNKKSDIYDFLLEEQKKSFIVKIFNALNISFNKINLLYIDLFLIKQRILEKCPIIDNVIITSSFYPSLKIQLIVKKPEAILYKKINNKEKYYFIDKFGEEIKINKPYLNNLLNNRNYKLPIVLGKNSEKNFFTTLSVLKKCGIDIETIYSMHYILERRWNLYLKDGLKIKLPENNQICRAIKIWELTKDQYIKAKYVDLRLTYLKQPLIYYN